MQKWDPDFNPAHQKTTNAKVWVRVVNLPWEYLHPQIFSDLAWEIGVPLRIENSTLSCSFGHFAHFHIDVDLSGALPIP